MNDTPNKPAVGIDLGIGPLGNAPRGAVHHVLGKRVRVVVTHGIVARKRLLPEWERVSPWDLG